MPELDEKFTCPHGELAGTSVLCARTADEIGALPVWKCCDSSKIIVTPYWCRERCKLQGGEGHL